MHERADTPAFSSVEAHCSGPDEERLEKKMYSGPEPVLQHAACSSSNLRPIRSDAYESLDLRGRHFRKSSRISESRRVPENSHPSIHREFASAGLERD